MPTFKAIVITKADGKTPLERQIVSWDRSRQEAEIWFRADVLSRTAREFFVYYGNPDTTLAAHDGNVFAPAYLGADTAAL